MAEGRKYLAASRLSLVLRLQDVCCLVDDGTQVLELVNLLQSYPVAQFIQLLLGRDDYEHPEAGNLRTGSISIVDLT